LRSQKIAFGYWTACKTTLDCAGR